MKKKSNKVKNLEAMFNCLNYLGNSKLNLDLYTTIQMLDNSGIINLNKKFNSDNYEKFINGVDSNIVSSLFDETYKNIAKGLASQNVSDDEKIFQLTNTAIQNHISDLKEKSYLVLSKDGTKFVSQKMIIDYKKKEEILVENERYEEAIKYRDGISDFM